MGSNYKTPLKSTDFGCPEAFSLCDSILESHTSFLMKITSFYQNNKIVFQYLTAIFSTTLLNIENASSAAFNLSALLDSLFSLRSHLIFWITVLASEEQQEL